MKKIIFLGFLVLLSCSDDYTEFIAHAHIPASNTPVRAKPDFNSNIIKYYHLGYEINISKKSRHTAIVDNVSYHWFFDGTGWVLGKDIIFKNRLSISGLLKSIPKYDRPELLAPILGEYTPIVKPDRSNIDIRYDILPNSIIQVDYLYLTIYKIINVQRINNNNYLVVMEFMYNMDGEKQYSYKKVKNSLYKIVIKIADKNHANENKEINRKGYYYINGEKCTRKVPRNWSTSYYKYYRTWDADDNFQ